MTLRRALLTLLLAGCAVLATATPALAHTSLRSSNPANGSTLTTPPTRVSLTFGEAVTVQGSPIRVTGPGGVALAVGPASVSGATVSAPVTGSGPAGAYTVSWTVVSDDGDAISGKVAFTVRGGVAEPAPVPAAAVTPSPAAAPTTTAAAVPAPVPAAAAETDTGGGVPWWVWIVGGAVVLAGAGGAVAARGRRSAG